MDHQTIIRVARRLNGGLDRNKASALARAMGVPVKTARAWMTDPSDASNHRSMSRTAQRLLATLLFLEAAGLLTDEFQRSVATMETILQGEPERLRAIMETLGEISDEQEDD